MWLLNGDKINSLQHASIDKLLRRCAQSSYVDISLRLRINGKFETVESSQADWIKYLRRVPADGSMDVVDALRTLLDAIEGNHVTVGDCNQARAALAKASPLHSEEAT